MSRIHVHIDWLVLNGFGQLEGNALAEALQKQISAGLGDASVRAEWARPHRTPVLKLGRMPLAAGATGATAFGKQMGRAVVRGLKP